MSRSTPTRGQPLTALTEDSETAVSVSKEGPNRGNIAGSSVHLNRNVKLHINPDYRLVVASASVLFRRPSREHACTGRHSAGHQFETNRRSYYGGERASLE